MLVPPAHQPACMYRLPSTFAKACCTRLMLFVIILCCSFFFLFLSCVLGQRCCCVCRLARPPVKQTPMNFFSFAQCLQSAVHCGKAGGLLFSELRLPGWDECGCVFLNIVGVVPPPFPTVISQGFQRSGVG